MQEDETNQTGQGDANKPESKREKLRKVSQEPIIGDQPTDLLHTRRNLLLISSIVIFSYFTGLEINPDRLKYYVVDGGNVVFHINLAALLINIYLWVSFAWKYTDFYDSQLILTTRRIRYKEKVALTMGNEIEIPEVDENYSIYPWWKKVEEISYNILNQMKSSLAAYEELDKASDKNYEQMKIYLSQVQGNCRRIISMNPYQKDVERAMEHFGRHFWQCIHSQKIRVSILEGWLPLLLGALALSILINKVFTEIGWL